ncbi:MAG: RimK/LysX family protein [Candidatus Andersenbacteria bacterium]|nr:RimK/LysX family protein [Candidatus Andersenbacteria bacterium]
MAAFLNKKWGDILGMNSRMLDYIIKSNSPESIRIANNKLATKKALQKAGLATPRLFAVVRNRTELRKFRWTKLPASFVLKPTSSSGGGGIIVMFGRNKKGNWVKANKTEVFIPELKAHIQDILDGNFSKGNVPDTAFFEQRVKIHATLKPYCVKGIPDVRVIIYNQVPVMAMLRLPTEESHGRANLHTGGIGAGIDISTGLTTSAIRHHKPIDKTPHNHLRISGIQIPFWDDILLLASRAAQACGLNYVGVDIAIDRDDGPLVLEVNARPGLDIQFANLSPLKSRLRRVEGLKMKSIEKKIQLAKNLFGAELDQEIEDIYGHTVLGIEEEVIIFDHEGRQYPVLAKIDTGAYRTTIDENLAIRLGINSPVIIHKGVRGALGRQTRPVISLEMSLRNRNIKTHASLIDRSHMKYDMIIGRRDMKGFYVNPSKIRQTVL